MNAEISHLLPFWQRKMNERRMAALKQDSSESESEDGATTYRSLAGMKGRQTLRVNSNYFC